MATLWNQGMTRNGQAYQLTTETWPVGEVGVDLYLTRSVTAVVHAPGSQTFDGTGTLLGYRMLLGKWVRSARQDIDMADFAGLTDASLLPIYVTSPIGRFLYVPSGVGLSGAGTNITTDYICTVELSLGTGGKGG